MARETEASDESPVLNLEKIHRISSAYKFPLILAGLGLLFFILPLAFLIKNQVGEKDVVFTNEATASAKTIIKIDIQGSILSPGVYNLKEGSRVADALSAAGGLSADADREYLAKYLNRAARLSDGQKIYIPSTTEEAVSGKSKGNLSNLGNLSDPAQKKLNINTASQGELEALSGVGPVTAGKIISGRPYQTIEELKNRKIIGSSLFEKIKDLISAF